MSDFHLVKAGAVTGRRKNKYPGEIVYGFAAGSNEMLEFLNDNPECVIRPIDEVVDTHLCGLNDKFVSINTCLMVTITGQVAAEAVNYMQISGTDVEYIATEYGIVNLRYKSNVERAAALISISHPDFREELRKGLVDQSHITVEDIPL